MLRIGIVLGSDSNWMGGIIYIENLLKALRQLPGEATGGLVQIVLIVDRTFDLQVHSERLSLADEVCLHSFPSLHPLLRLGIYALNLRLWYDRGLVELVNQKRLDFVYPVSPADIPAARHFACGWSAWIPDFQHKYLPQFFPRWERLSRDIKLRYIAKNASNIVFSSYSAEKDFLRFYAQSPAQRHVLRFTSIPSDTWCESTDSVLLICQKYQLPERFFLVSNQFWIHKNHRLIVRALDTMRAQGLELPLVVCTGQLHDHRAPGYGQELASLVAGLGLQAHFQILGLIPRWEQIQLMRGCVAVIQPSLFEGWSTVVEDAKSLGKKILLSDLPVHLEQQPVDATYFQSDRVEALVAAIQSLGASDRGGFDRSAEVAAQERNLRAAKHYAAAFLTLVGRGQP
jgi:glycosyltransferase involved in cell wall biosynthesis